MTPEQIALALKLKAELDKREAAKSPARFIKSKPTPRQREFLQYDGLEALYGGAAGGGKSEALLMAALQYVHVPGYAALILRRTYRELALPGAIMDRAHSWLQGTGAEWNGTEKRWTFPSGATLTFGYLDTEADKYRYQGAELTAILIDEVTQWPEQWYRYLFSRLRKKEGVNVPLRMRGATNPGGIGHEWVRRRFIDNAGTPGAPKFFPAKLSDNPHVDQGSYREALELLDANTRRQLLEGIWVRDAGGLVYTYDDALNGIDAAPELQYFILGIDYGFKDDTAFTVMGWREHDPTVYAVEAFKVQGTTPSKAAEVVRELEKRFPLSRIVADVGGLGKGYAEEARQRFGLPIEPAEKTNKRGYIDLFNGDMQRGAIKVLRGKCAPLLAEWAELPWTEDRSKESDGFANHCCFVAGTMVDTPRGPVAIESLKAGDEVTTVGGTQRVEAAWCSGIEPLYRMLTDDGRELVGTHDHPIFVAGHGFVPMAKLWPGAELVACESRSEWRLSSSTAGSTGGTRTVSTVRRASTSTMPASFGGFTATSGSTRTAPSRADITFTTRTATRSTIRPTTWSASLRLSTSASMLTTSGARTRHGCFSSVRFPRPQSGTAPKRAALGIARTASAPTRIACLFPARAKSAGAPSPRRSRGPASALPSATRVSAGRLGWTTSRSRALAARASSVATSTTSPGAAPCRVRSVTAINVSAPVFNLTVASEHHYFASGVLVSNCDAALYCWRACVAYPERALPKKPKPGTDEWLTDLESKLISQREESVRTSSEDNPFAPQWWERPYD